MNQSVRLSLAEILLAQRLALVSLLVREYDEAIRFYVEKLGFELVEDRLLGGEKRWVRIAPPRGHGTQILLARAANANQSSRVGNQTVVRVFLFVETDDFDGDYDAMLGRGVEFTEPPRDEAYGRVAVFKDLYGNRIDLIQPA